MAYYGTDDKTPCLSPGMSYSISGHCENNTSGKMFMTTGYGSQGKVDM